MNDVVDSTDVAHFEIGSSLLYGPDYRALEKHTQILLSHPANHLMICLSFECPDPSQWRDDLIILLKKLKHQRPKRQIFLVINVWYKQFDWSLIDGLIDDIYFLDQFLIRSWLFYCHYKLAPINQTWSPDSKKFLFLIGKPYRFNRARLLYKFKLADLTKSAVWSLSDRQDYRSQNHIYLSELSESELADFLSSHERILDRPYEQIEYGPYVPNLSEFKKLIPHKTLSFMAHDIRIYQNKLFCVIPETEFDRLWDGPRLTEKTWNHIIHHLPFLIAGEQKSSTLLENMGFDTFKDLLAIPNFDDPDQQHYLKPQSWQDLFLHYSWQPEFKNYFNTVKDVSWPSINELVDDPVQHQIILHELLQGYQDRMAADIEHRLNAVVTNTMGWVKKKSLGPEVQLRLEHNFSKFNQIGEKLFNDYKNWCGRHGLSKCVLDSIFTQGHTETPDYSIHEWLNGPIR